MRGDFALDKVATFVYHWNMDQERTTAEIYAPDLDSLIDWEGLEELDPGDIKMMMPLIMERLLALI